MLDVVTTSFYIKSGIFEKDSFEHLALTLFDEWDEQVASTLQLADYSLTLVVEEGSIKGKGKIAASAAVLYFAIGHYGDFVSGLATIKSQAEYVTSALFQQAKSQFNCETTLGNTKRSGGEIFYLEQLFHRVRVGALSPDRAMQEIRERWGEEAASSPDFMRDLARVSAFSCEGPTMTMFRSPHATQETDPCGETGRHSSRRAAGEADPRTDGRQRRRGRVPEVEESRYRARLER